MVQVIYILLATYNGANYLREQLDSIIGQTYTNWILWIHDDNSQDGTVTIIKEYRDRFPQKIFYLDDTLSTGGAKENFSFLLNNIDTNFDYIMFSDQDDVWLEDKIEKTLALMLETERENPKLPLLIHTDLMVTDAALNIVASSMRKSQRLDISKQNDLKKMCADSIISGCTMMINAVLFKLSRNIPNEAIMHDTWMPLIALKYGGKIGYLPEGTLYYRQHLNNTEGAKHINMGFYLRRVLHFSSVISEYKKMYFQCQKADIKISLTRFLFLRLYAVINKIL